MRHPILFLILAVIVSSCINNNDDFSESELVGKYQLIETYADPGDGSGTFRPIDSDKTLQFNANGRVYSNREICSFRSSSGAESPSSGTFSIQDSLISSPGCDDLGFSLEGNELIVGYFCIEGCAAKYERI